LSGRHSLTQFQHTFDVNSVVWFLALSCGFFSVPAQFTQLFPNRTKKKVPSPHLFIYLQGVLRTTVQTVRSVGNCVSAYLKKAVVPL